MTTENDRIRRELGFDLVKAAQKSKPQPTPQPSVPKNEKTDRRK